MPKLPPKISSAFNYSEEQMTRGVYIVGALLLGAASIGGLFKLHDAGVEKGQRKQAALDKERAKKKGFEL